jgi:hypothetical protein
MATPRRSSTLPEVHLLRGVDHHGSGRSVDSPLELLQLTVWGYLATG